MTIIEKIASAQDLREAINFAHVAIERIAAAYLRARPPRQSGQLSRPWVCGEATISAIKRIEAQVGMLKSAAIARGAEL